MKRAISFKIEEHQLRMLDRVSQTAHIPKSALIRRGIHLAILQAQEDVVSTELRREIGDLLHEDRQVLKRLAKA